MRTATIDHQRGVFHARVHEAGRIIGMRSGGYREVIAYTKETGVPRASVTLTEAAQAAALSACFGGAS